MPQYIKKIIATVLTTQVLIGCAQQPREREDYHNLSCDEIKRRLSVTHAKYNMAQEYKDSIASALFTSYYDRIRQDQELADGKMDLMRLENAYYAKKCQEGSQNNK